MFNNEPVIRATKTESIGLVVVIVALISLCMIVLKTVPHIPIIVSILLLLGFGISKKISMNDLQSGMTAGASSGLSAVFLFFFIGMIISAFMISGTIPTLIYIGLHIADWPFYFAIVFVITAIIGMSIGSSLTTVATLGVAFIGVSTALDVSLAVTAGAIVSGAFFGDKMSPLSDTTNLASSIVEVDLFEHIKNMAWTTVPAFIISLLVFGLLSPGENAGTAAAQIGNLQQGLSDAGGVHWYGLLPLVLLLVLAVKKTPAILSLAVTIVFSIALSYLHSFTSLADLSGLLFEGYKSESGIEEIDSLLTRGGINSMMFTVALVILALGLGGLLFKLGIIQTLLGLIENKLKKASSTLVSAAFTAIGINAVIGEQYLSILLTGESFKRPIDDLNLARKNLSRVLEDAGTVINPLVPWGVCGVFITNVLGVSTLTYLPFAVFCLASPILTVIFSATGWTITKNKM
ncbi:Na+/H+ antiporter NhaC [Jeotgalibacillus sp. S-D1]|uniref:Na+/H+ antiporter NhaC n=1 Tax=Jeotgalibacillus sp. S-D1 TaxID=2552189 RepID=UPI001059A65C|nr:Na+/H+ antiporter NhaC [Jeotgalibacillus sp. S-D1]TDL35244.1 Na+/H+ antiporter NhaC [Jeotgalibacillus sp. S-D1]